MSAKAVELFCVAASADLQWGASGFDLPRDQTDQVHCGDDSHQCPPRQHRQPMHAVFDAFFSDFRDRGVHLHRQRMFDHHVADAEAFDSLTDSIRDILK
jgi:hypothetical protein